MNRFIGVGRLTRNAIELGTENKATTFTVMTGLGDDEYLRGEKLAFVPYVYFNPPELIWKKLVEEGQGLEVNFE